MWDTLALPWQACLTLAWEAYCDGCYPIGAVVTEGDGTIISRGRNRIHEHRLAGDWRNGEVLAHAEVEALNGVKFDAVDVHACSLYSIMEPCPMCMGTFYMSGVRTLHYAARDPFAGSVNLLGTTWYLKRKPIKIFGPPNPRLEIILLAMLVEQDCSLHGGELPENDVYRRWAEVVPRGVEFGQLLGRTGEIRAMREKGAAMDEVLNRLITLVK